MEQMPLFNTPLITCLICGAHLRNLSELRSACSASADRGIHQVSTGNYFALYRNAPAAATAGV